MARLYHCGFELDSLTAGVEFGSPVAIVGGSIQTSIVHGGVYAYRSNPSSSVTVVQIAMASGTMKTVFFRFYYYVTTHPASAALVFTVMDTSGTVSLARLRGTGSGLRALNASNVQVGSDFALSTGRWYRIEMKVFSNASTGTIDVLVDGVSVVSVTGTNTGGSDIAVVQFGSSAALSHDYYIDDFAANDSTADMLGTNTSYPGAGQIICIRPDSPGDFALWTRGGADSGANWSQVNEVTPNDATNYVQTATLSNDDMYNCTASGIGASDVVKAVGIGVRLTNDTSDVVTAVKVLLEKATSGTLLQSAAIIPGSTTWRTNVSGTGFGRYPIMTDVDPNGSAWTQATLDTMQIGQIISAVGTHNILVSTVWAMVDYTPSAGGNTLKTVNGLAATSIKTIQTLARASVKTYDGLTPP